MHLYELFHCTIQLGIFMDLSCFCLKVHGYKTINSLVFKFVFLMHVEKLPVWFLILFYQFVLICEKKKKKWAFVQATESDLLVYYVTMLSAKL